MNKGLDGGGQRLEPEKKIRQNSNVKFKDARGKTTAKSVHLPEAKKKKRQLL